MSEPVWLELRSALVDTGVFILWYRAMPGQHVSSEPNTPESTTQQDTVNRRHFDPITEIEVVPSDRLLHVQADSGYSLLL